jgi:hypothetical protein
VLGVAVVLASMAMLFTTPHREAPRS